MTQFAYHMNLYSLSSASSSGKWEELIEDHCEAWQRDSRCGHIHCQGASTHHIAPSCCWQEEDDYESPNDDADAEDDGDYESPNEEEEAPVEDDADYEPPPSNDEEALQNSILPAKPLSNPNSMYIGKGPGAQPPAPLMHGRPTPMQQKAFSADANWPAVWLWASNSTSLGLRFLICEIEQ